MKTVIVRLGQIVLIGLVVVSGVAGWFGVEKYVIADNSDTLPSLGEGLPTVRFASPEVEWRRWVRTDVSPTREQKLWLDIDALESKADELKRDPAAPMGTPPVLTQLELRDDLGYKKLAGNDWTALEPENARGATEALLSGSRPRLLTQVVPPAVVPFVVLTDEQEKAGIRTYSMSVDASAFRAARPLDFERWILNELNDEELPRFLTISVRSDGYVVSVESATANSVTTVTWQDFTGPIPMVSPIGPTPVTSAPATGTTPPLGSTVPTLPTTLVPG